MSRYSEKPLSFEGLKTVPIDARGGKVRVEHFARPYRKGEGVAGLAGFSAEDSGRRCVSRRWSRRCGEPRRRSERFSGAWAGT